jgi:hypothetical protein
VSLLGKSIKDYSFHLIWVEQWVANRHVGTYFLSVPIIALDIILLIVDLITMRENFYSRRENLWVIYGPPNAYK